MPLTIGDLISTPELGLRLLTENTRVDRAITWVHVSELRDPTPFLTGGELLLTTGIVTGSGDAAGAFVEEYVRLLADADVVGLGFGIGLSHHEVPADLVAAAARRGLPLLEVPRNTPFIALSRAVSRALAADEYAAVTKTFTAQQTLTRAALSAAGPDRLVRQLAQQVGAWVALFDRAGAVLAAHPDLAGSRLAAVRPEVAVLAAHRGPVGSAFDVGADTVSLQSVGAGPRGRGFLAVGRPGGLTAAQRHLVNAAVMLLTIMLEHSRSTDAALGQVRSALMRLMLSGLSELAGPIADAISAPLPAGPVTVLVATGEAAARVGPDDSSVSFGGPALAAVVDGELIALVGGDPAAVADAAKVVAVEADVVIGLAGPVDLDDIPAGYRQALQAADFGRRHRRPVTGFAEISMPGITGMLGHDQAVAFAESLLQPLVEHDKVGRGDLVVSLRTWLAHHGQWDPSAAALGVHRHTLRHRIRTAEELLGRSFDSPGTRGEVWLALEVLDSAGPGLD
ncbi:PucR family transcriptional regulator [Nakamurella sp. GG22]